MKILIVDDNPIVRAGLSMTLSQLDGVDAVLEASDGHEALDALGQADVAFLDVRMPGLDGIEVLRRRTDDTPVVMLTHSDEPSIIRDCLALGARGYLIHGNFDAEDLLAALRTAQRGGAVLSPAAAQTALSGSEPAAAPSAARPTLGLTAREVELMDALAEGLSNGDIARRLFLSEKTVKNHLGRIYAKLGVANRGGAIVSWLER
ncbi:response regulator [Serinicoccus kebangsaanensis]|uniref:response regulator n=1 Tax=Serinicoccus kebangsaanensis TaxID=2602069 RepID=UPI00124E7C5D|nr:response regulator transcription factor [Serinicoccus kebangsaanensis]